MQSRDSSGRAAVRALHGFRKLCALLTDRRLQGLRTMSWLFASRLRPFVLLAGAASLLLNLAMLVPAIYMTQVFDRVFASRSVETLVMLSILARSRSGSATRWTRCAPARWRAPAARSRSASRPRRSPTCCATRPVPARRRHRRAARRRAAARLPLAGRRAGADGRALAAGVSARDRADAPAAGRGRRRRRALLVALGVLTERLTRAPRSAPCSARAARAAGPTR